ncbi:hypothetical protein GLW05_20905 [Pontibacillus yanchengensis]|uniref:Uncharacterized protein n=1 Tax=Pontibacillus yanchengensis TaxID=462910 RepID=A0A6I5A6T3_9BACI|nr:hypothetical protein [Pontibacillus yanchengensis]MYL36034.1 hypothetical protein [Pontibacillus yanchengensis]
MKEIFAGYDEIKFMLDEEEKDNDCKFDEKDLNNVIDLTLGSEYRDRFKELVKFSEYTRKI